MSWHPEPTEEEKILLEIITPYVKLHGGAERRRAGRSQSGTEASLGYQYRARPVSTDR